MQQIQAFVPQMEHFIFQLISRSVSKNLRLFLCPQKEAHKNNQPITNKPIPFSHPIRFKNDRIFPPMEFPWFPSGIFVKGKKLRCQPISMLILGGSMYKSRGEWMDLREWRVGKLAVCQDKDLRRFFWILEVSTAIWKIMLVNMGILPKWVFPEIGVPQNGWFTMEIPIKLDDLGVPPFSETPK